MNKVLKAFSLTGFDDPSEIYYSSGLNAFETLLALKDEIIAIYPRRNTSRLRKGIQKKDLDSIRALKEILRYYNMSLISNRIQSKDGCTYKYKIVK
jgi:hypothetical protein